MSKRNGQKEGNKEAEKGKEGNRGCKEVRDVQQRYKERKREMGRVSESFTHAGNNFAVVQRSRVYAGVHVCVHVCSCVYMVVYVAVCLYISVCVCVFDVSSLLAVCRAVKGCH